jgi:hypothetical protein
MASVYRVANDRVRLLVFADDGTWLSLLYDGALGGFASFERSAPAPRKTFPLLALRAGR